MTKKEIEVLLVLSGAQKAPLLSLKKFCPHFGGHAFKQSRGKYIYYEPRSREAGYSVIKVCELHINAYLENGWKEL